MGESFFAKKLKDIDAFKRLPKEVTKGSLIGVLLSFFTLVAIMFLLINEVALYLGFTVESGMKIDHRRQSKEVEVHIDIIFHNQPCHLLGLDVIDYVGTHNENVHDNIQRIEIDKDGVNIGPIQFEDNDTDEIAKKYIEAVKRGDGCRLVGYFTIFMVPGNFHIGFHSSMPILKRVVEMGHRVEVDFSHTISDLYFGTSNQHHLLYGYQKDFKLKHLNVLESFSSSKMAPTKGPYSFKYKLLVLPTELDYEDGRTATIFQYRTFWNIAYFEQGYNYLISFDYELSAITLTESRIFKPFHTFLIHILGILGGLLSFASFAHTLLQSSLLPVLHKHSLGKYD